jgi:hypothetical protein
MLPAPELLVPLLALLTMPDLALLLLLLLLPATGDGIFAAGPPTFTMLG